MRSLLGEDFSSESFPCCDRKFVKSRDSWHKGNTGRPCDSEIELSSDPLVRNISYSLRQTGRAFGTRFGFCRVRTQESFGQCLHDEGARSNSRSEIAFRMKPGESNVYRETRYSQVRRQLPR